MAWIIGWDLILEYLFAASHRGGGLVGLRGLAASRTWGSTFPRQYTGRRPIPTPWRADDAGLESSGSLLRRRLEQARDTVLNVPAMIIVVR